MIKARLDGLYFLILGSMVFILLGPVLANNSPGAMVDFRGQYYPARCLIQHCDPYNEAEVIRISRAEGGDRPSDTANASHFARYIYFPTAFSFTIPFAMLPWGPAHILWMLLTLVSLIFASFLIWNIGANSAPTLAGVLVGFLVANSELLLVFGNMAGIAISLCVVAVWCFFEERFVCVGILCLAVSIALKPQDAGLIWLYFLLAGGVYRERALQTLLATVAITGPVVLWVWRVSPNWMQEMHSNIVIFSGHGGLSDPDLMSTGTIGIGMVISLQTVTSVFSHNPRVYSLVSYLVCAPPLILWAFVSLRTRPSPERAWLALAAIAALSMLPVYHRQHDAKLLLLTIPACAMLWAEGGVVGRLAFLTNAAGFVVTGDLPGAIIFNLTRNLHFATPGLSTRIATSVQVFPAPLTLLAMGIFYLWVYARRSNVFPTTSIYPHKSMPASEISPLPGAQFLEP
ncbi:MAG: glycosyltransferase family 87 protein [Terracidiphilus sp.]